MYSSPASTALPVMARGIALNGSEASAPNEAAASNPTNPSTARTTANTTPSGEAPFNVIWARSNR